MRGRAAPTQEIRNRSSAGWASSASTLAIAALFVLLWASGLVVPRAFGPYIEPITFVAARNGGAALVLIIIALALRRPWPSNRNQQFGLMWAGALLQGFFLMAVYWSIHRGLPVGIAALAAGLQPAMTAMFAGWMIGERVSARQWIGIGLGFVGLVLVMTPKLGAGHAATTAGLAVLALAGVACASYASIYQKRFETAGDAVTRTALIFVGALIPPLIGAPLIEEMHVTWAVPLLAVYAWSVVALAIGATMALLHLIRKGQAAKAASLIYLVPPVSAAMAYLGFGETVAPVQIAGFAVAAFGVGLVQVRRAT
jgi:drug/metabolite transporter (DMT)-like permease